VVATQAHTTHWKAFHTKKTSQLRTIPIKEEVIPERRVGTYDGAREIVERSEGPFGVLNYVCRQGGAASALTAS
jgi:hypothetical protein